MQELIGKIQSVLTPDLLVGRWQEQANPLQGHCYAASEALYHMLGRTDWKPMCASYADGKGKATHWWIQHRTTGEVLDPTAGQFAPNQPPYHLGKGCGFLTKNPSRRAQTIIERVQKI